MSLNFFLLFFWNFFNWPNLSKNNSVLKVHLKPTKPLRWNFFAKLVNGFYPLTILVKEFHCRYSTGFWLCLWYCLVMLFGMLMGRYQKPRFSGLVYTSLVLYMLRGRKEGIDWQKNRLQKDKTCYWYRENFKVNLQKIIIFLKIQYKSTLTYIEFSKIYYFL